MNNKDKKVSSKKIKYGTSAVIFTTVFVVFVILVNVLVSYIDSTTGGLYVDMTTEQLYGVGENTMQVLEEIDKPVEIIFCSPRDRIVDDDLMNPVAMLAESYEKSFDNVSVIYKDMLSDKKFFEGFKKTRDDIISSYSVIVSCPSTGLSKIYEWKDMYKYNTEGLIFAFDGEYKITSAILSTARSDDNMLLAGLVTGHGEDTGHGIRHFLEDCGYDVMTVDLKEISKQELSRYDLLLVCNPTVDFIGMEKTEIELSEDEQDAENPDTTSAGDASTQTQPAYQPKTKSVNEIELLRDYVTEDFGNLFFFFDPNFANMPELFSLIEDGFGVRISNLYPVVDYGSMLNYNAYSQDMRFLGLFSEDNTSPGYKMHKDISGVNNPAFGISCLMDIPKKNVGSMEISPIVTASENAVVLTGEEVMEVPYIPLMTLSRYTKLVDSNEVSGNAVICASSAFVDELDNPSFANADLFKNMLSEMGNDNAALDIEFKVLDESAIEVTTSDVEKMMRKLGIAVPVIIAILGIAVFIKRKYL